MTPLAIDLFCGLAGAAGDFTTAEVTANIKRANLRVVEQAAGRRAC